MYFIDRIDQIKAEIQELKAKQTETIAERTKLEALKTKTLSGTLLKTATLAFVQLDIHNRESTLDGLQSELDQLQAKNDLLNSNIVASSNKYVEIPSNSYKSFYKRPDEDELDFFKRCNAELDTHVKEYKIRLIEKVFIMPNKKGEPTTKKLSIKKDESQTDFILRTQELVCKGGKTMLATYELTPKTNPPLQIEYKPLKYDEYPLKTWLKMDYRDKAAISVADPNIIDHLSPLAEPGRKIVYQIDGTQRIKKQSKIVVLISYAHHEIKGK